MNTDTAAYYSREADRLARGPQLYGGDPSIVALRCFRRYHADALEIIRDGDGRQRWMTPKQMRIQALLARAEVSGQRTTMHAIAKEACVRPSTVSRTILKLEAWRLFAVDVYRGRNGGIRVWRPIGARFELYAIAARQTLARLKRKALNVASTLLRRGGGEVEVPVSARTDLDATFSETPAMKFARQVLEERRRLAIIDPEGEKDAVRPLW